MTTIIPLPGPGGTLVYPCPICGQLWPTMTEALLCELVHTASASATEEER